MKKPFDWKVKSDKEPREQISNWWFSDADLQEVASMIVDVDPYHASVHRDDELDAEDQKEEAHDRNRSNEEA